MNFPTLDNVLWLTGFVLNTSLLICLQLKKGEQRFFWFRVWIGLNVVETLTLFFVYKLNLPHLYAQLFWVGAFLDCAAQVAVLLELAKCVLMRNRSWVGKTKHVLALIISSSLMFSIAMAVTVTPAASTQLDSVFARCNLFLTILVCLSFTGIVLSTSRYGLSWSGEAGRIGVGLGFWTALSFASDTLHAYWRTMPYFDGLETVRTVSYQVVLIYWLFYLCRSSQQQTPLDFHVNGVEVYSSALAKE